MECASKVFQLIDAGLADQFAPKLYQLLHAVADRTAVMEFFNGNLAVFHRHFQQILVVDLECAAHFLGNHNPA